MRNKLKKSTERVRSLWRDLGQKQRFAVMDGDDGTERWYMYISPLRILIGLVVLVAIMFGVVVLVVAYTPVMDTIPGYPGSRSREMLVENIMRLDSLEREMANLTMYSDNIDLIMDGKTPVVRDVSRIGDSIEIREKVAVTRNAADSAMRARMEGPGAYSLASSVAATRALKDRFDLVAPASGLVQTKFDPMHGRFGVGIATTANHPVAAVRDGSIILSVWTPGSGNVVQIQHSDNLVSVYRRVSGLKGGVGSRVKRGEIIGIAGSVAPADGSDTGTGTAGPLEFELWYNGTAVDPENYIVF
jgi:hypothetical protein